MRLYAIKINGLTNPIGYDLNPPVVSWKVRDAAGKTQKQVTVQVLCGRNDICSCSGDSLGTVMDVPLEPRTRYDVKVTVESDSGEIAEGRAFFETGKLSEPWMAKWIGGVFDFHPELQKAFSLRKGIKSARLYISGLGLFEAYLNGEKVGNDFLAHFINDYASGVQYCTYDVTELVKTDNTLAVLLGNGWYRGRYGLSGRAHCPPAFHLFRFPLRACQRNGAAERCRYHRRGGLHRDGQNGLFPNRQREDKPSARKYALGA